MIRIYDKEEKIFSNLGLGSLDEALAALVVEELNGSYELEMQYPLKGRHFDKLQLKNIIFCKPNMYTRDQPFRIYSITKPIDGKVTVNAEHISYDASGVTILPKRNSETKVIESFGVKDTHNDEEGYFLDTILTDPITGIKAMSVLPDKNYFNLILGSDKENVFKKDGYSIPAPINLRSMLGGESGSILEKFKGEYVFDRFDVILKNKRGVDRGLTIRYGKNMTDIEHESEGNNLFTAIFPFYSKNYTETQQTTKPIFQETYIIERVTPLRADWLSIELIDVSKKIGGINLKPVVEVMKVIVDGIEDLVERYAPIRVKTPNDPDNPTNDFYDKIYVFKRNTEDDGNLIKAYVKEKRIDQITVNDELKDIEVITELKLNKEDTTAITPIFGKIYVIQSEDSEHYNRKMIWDKGNFVEYPSDGFYVEAKDATLVDTLKDLKPLPTHPISWDEVNSKWIEDHQNGSIYVEPKKPNIGTVSVDKYVYVDLLEYELLEESDVLLENGVMYVNETLKNLSNQRMLTLDLTDDLDSIDNLEPTDITSQHLFDKAEQYLKDNDLTKLKESITISFIKLSDSTEYEHLKALEIVELGDEVNVIYEELGINSKHRVIATHYNVLTDSYDEIELGEKTAKITNNIVSSGDNVSSLKNDAEYTEKTYVVNFVAENANIINAEIQKAIIKTLEASNVNISGLLVASHATIDDLVSQMLVTDNAKISELLEAGSVRVRGKITALSGEIGGCKIEDGKLQVTTSISIISEDETKQFEVNENGEVTANSITITGGSITMGKMGEFYTENVFEVTNEGKLIAKDAEIEGSVSIKEGSIKIGGTEEEPNFEVTNEGHIVAKSAQIGDGYINEEGRFILPSANITGALTIGQLPEEVAVTDDIPTVPTKVSELENDTGFQDETGITTIVRGVITTDYVEALGIVLKNSIKIGGTSSVPNFHVDTDGNMFGRGIIDLGNFKVIDGNVEANNLKLSKGSSQASVTIDEYGKLTAQNAYISGDIKTDIMDVKKLVIDDTINIELINDAGTYYQQIVNIISSSTVIVNVSNSQELWVDISLDKDLWHEQTIAVTVKYKSNRDTSYIYKTFSSRLTPGVYDNAATKTYRLFSGVYLLYSYGDYFTNHSISSKYPPSNWTENASNPAYTSASIDSHFSPLYSETYDLGKDNRRWNEIFAIDITSRDQPNVDSDIRLKKEVNYDISSFDKIFDELKPATFKYIDGRSGRKHLGLIAQDLKNTLDSNSIDTVEFAGFIKKFKDPNILLKKREEELTEDDYRYSIRYSEIYILLIRQIQLLKKQLKELAEKVDALENDEGS